MPVSKGSVTFFDKDFKPESLADVLNKADQLWIERLRESLQSNDRVSTGSLQQSLHAETKASPTYVSFEIRANKYWKAVDKGRAPGKKAPPKQAMLDFIRNRGIVPDQGRTESAYQSLAYILAQGIKKNGIKATNFVSEAIGRREIDSLKKDIVKAMKMALL